MKIKTSELTKQALDYAVRHSMDAAGLICAGMHGRTVPHWSPSTNWSQGGPIIEQHQIRLTYSDLGKAWAQQHLHANGTQAHTTSFSRVVLAEGPTVLVAAMRCFVASKLGDEVDIPDELIKE